VLLVVRLFPTALRGTRTLSELFPTKIKGATRRPVASPEGKGRLSRGCLEEINQHYRQAIRIYHPDKVAEMAPEIIALAEQRTKELNAAFSQAKRVRGGIVE
jgi:hypothetical protein